MLYTRLNFVPIGMFSLLRHATWLCYVAPMLSASIDDLSHLPYSQSTECSFIGQTGFQKRHIRHKHQRRWMRRPRNKHPDDQLSATARLFTPKPGKPRAERRLRYVSQPTLPPLPPSRKLEKQNPPALRKRHDPSRVAPAGSWSPTWGCPGGCERNSTPYRGQNKRSLAGLGCGDRLRYRNLGLWIESLVGWGPETNSTGEGLVRDGTREQIEILWILPWLLPVYKADAK